jgi:hypothetical protein
MKITRRDIKFFFFGVLTMIILEIIFNWSDFKTGYNKGLEEGRATFGVEK